jgi:hypothetical protein
VKQDSPVGVVSLELNVFGEMYRRERESKWENMKEK